MYVNTKAVVIKEMKLGDNDKLLTLFSENLGKISVIARGARRQGNRLSAVRLLCYASFVLFKSSKGYSLSEFEIINSFAPVSADIEKLALASYFSEIVCGVTAEKVADNRLLSLYLNSLYIICGNTVPLSLAKAVFELKCSCLIGYEPFLSGCILCGGNADCFSVMDGGTVCVNCRPRKKRADVHVPAVMRYICGAPDKRIFSFRASSAVIDEISAVCEEYLLNCVEFIPNSLEMYKNLVAN